MRCLSAWSASIAAAVAASLMLSGALGNAKAAGDAPVPEPDSYRTDAYRTPVPKTLKGAKVVAVEEAEAIYKDRKTVFIDVFPRAPKPPNLPAGTVWRDPTHMTIEGAHWLPNVGYGVLSAEFESYFRSRLATLTGNDAAKPVMFFCLKDCWMSWNAAKRALEWGYTNVIWFPDGTDAWQQAGSDLVKATPVP
jgi:PQQ-dependent catabolism-associated CXXCW motif protein